MIHVPDNFKILLTALAFTSIFPGSSPAGNTYYVDPDQGEDVAAPTGGTLTNPWKTFFYATRPGRLSPGDTLILRGGIYRERGQMSLGISGTAAEPITIKNFDGEVPVLDGSYEEFLTVPNAEWELDPDEDPAVQIYRSKKTYPALQERKVRGVFEGNGRKYSLVTYQNINHLRTTNEAYDPNAHIYVGPGVVYDPTDQKIRIRLQTTQIQNEMGLVFPSNPNPNENKLFIFNDFVHVEFGDNGSYLIMDGLNFANQGTLSIWIREQREHITIRNCTFNGGINVRGDNVLIDNILIRGFIPPWVSWSDVKDGLTPAKPIQSGGISIGGENVEVRNSQIFGIFDGISAGGQNSSIHGNWLMNLRDDGINIPSGSRPTDIYNNYFFRVGQAISHIGTGTPPVQGGKYIHHNIIDLSGEPHLKARRQADGTFSGFSGPENDGMNWGLVIGVHATADMGPNPWKFYNNTLIMKYASAQDNYKMTVAPEVPHEVYNNIYVQLTDTKVRSKVNLVSGEEIYDGNHYYRVNAPTTPLFEAYFNGVMEKVFSSLQEFRDDPFFIDSQQVYPPGFENSSVEADPLLDENYFPNPSGPAATGAVDLSGTGWPMTDGDPYRGAVKPIKGAHNTFAVNVGSSSAYTDGNGIVYEGDGPYITGGVSTSKSNQILDTEDDPLYRTNRWGNFSAAFDLADGDYEVALKFADLFRDRPGERVFDVLVEGQVALNDWDLHEQIRPNGELVGQYTAFDLIIPARVDDGVLNLQFVPVVNQAMVSAIFVRPAPYSTTIAINAGNSSSSYTDGNGITYQTDRDFAGGTTTTVSGAAIDATPDDQIYRSNRFGSNFSYNIPMSDGNYLLTLKFADLFRNDVNERLMDITVEGNLVADDLDVFLEAGKFGAYDLPIPVTVQGGQLNISLQGVLLNAMISGMRVQPDQ